jgi:hypothetical protein
MKYTKFMLSASAMAVALILSSGAFAQTTLGKGQGNADDGSTAVTAVGNSVDNGNTSNLSTDNNNNQSKTTTTTADNNNNQSKNTTVTADNGNNQSKNITADNNNNQSKNTTVTADNGNNQSKNTTADNGNNSSKNTTVTADNGNNQSKNTTTTISVSKPDSSVHTMSTEALNGTVSGISITNNSNPGTALATGAIAGSTYTSFAGIQTSSLNTGLASINQAATSIAANANVTFGP